MRRSVTFLFALAFTFCCGVAGAGEPRATPDEARHMCERAAAIVQSIGTEKAFAEFMREGGAFHDRELFVVVMDPTGTVLAHGARAKYVGLNMAELTDVRGVRFVERMLAMPEDGFIDYAWQNPLTNRVEQKRSWVVHRPGFVAFVGAYLPTDG